MFPDCKALGKLDQLARAAVIYFALSEQINGKGAQPRKETCDVL